MIQHLQNVDEYEKYVQQGNVVVDFFATWCGPCRMMARVLEEIEEEYKSIVFLKVDVDKFPQIAQRFGVMSIPTFLAYKDGKRINFSINGERMEELVGGLQEEGFKQVLNDTFGL